VHPGHELFTSSSDGGKTWSPAVEVGGSAGTISDTEWWIDGDLSTDRAGNLYATWDTQSAPGDSDIGWLSYSTDRGRSWSVPIRATPDHDNAVHIVESAGAGPGIADIAWQADNSPQGYATYLRPFSIRHGWLPPVTQVSSQYGDPAIWPGDTFGISVLPGRLGPSDPVTREAGFRPSGRADPRGGRALPDAGREPTRIIKSLVDAAPPGSYVVGADRCLILVPCQPNLAVAPHGERPLAVR
jgi:hypothetical protein